MSKKQSGASKIGGAFGDLIRTIGQFLTTLFCVLRACDVINWNWFWVMSPTFFTWAIALILLVIIGCAAFATTKGD